MVAAIVGPSSRAPSPALISASHQQPLTPVRPVTTGSGAGWGQLGQQLLDAGVEVVAMVRTSSTGLPAGSSSSQSP
jgi:hypothetical protein